MIHEDILGQSLSSTHSSGEFFVVDIFEKRKIRNVFIFILEITAVLSKLPVSFLS